MDECWRGKNDKDAHIRHASPGKVRRRVENAIKKLLTRIAERPRGFKRQPQIELTAMEPKSQEEYKGSKDDLQAEVRCQNQK